MRINFLRWPSNSSTAFECAAYYCLLSLALWPGTATAHNPLTESASPAVMTAALLLLVVWLSYGFGCLRLPPARHRWWAFQVACVLAALALFGPLDSWAETNTAAHMVQHMLMMVVIAPLWVIARPLPQWHALQPTATRIILAPLLWGAGYPLLAAAVHGAVIWLWHAPKLYVLALENPWWHLFEHLCFLLSAGVFWWSVLRSQQSAAPRALLALLATLMHTGFLGALLTFSESSLYGAERPLAHQQLAGLLMWVLGGLPYFAAALWIGWRWFRRVGMTD